MARPPHLSRAIQQGFTLVELIMVIVLMGVVGGMVAVFMRGPIDAYLAQGRRSGLSDVADTTARRMARDLHRALPNSVRTSGTNCLEFIPTKTGGRYRADGPGLLDFSTATSSFNLLGEAFALQKVPRAVRGRFLARKKAARAAEEAARKEVEA